MQAQAIIVPEATMSDDRIARLEGKVDTVVDSVKGLAASIEKFATTANNLAQAIARHDAHSEVQSEVNKNVQHSLKALADAIQALKLDVQTINSNADNNARDIEQIKQRVTELELRQRETENAVLRNETRLNPIWDVGKKVMSAVMVAAVTGALTAYYLGKQ